MNYEDNASLHDMCNLLKHRGPDSDGFFESKNVSFGIRRLSIIDIEGGNQPISNEDGKIWTIFNGEIYNYQSLQDGLKSKGHKFKTNSDTETIVHAYEEYDIDFVNHLQGMFAIAIWDEKKNRTILARDRFGVKPLYYHIQNNKLLFASELKVLLEYDEIKPTINHKNHIELGYLSHKEVLKFLCKTEIAVVPSRWEEPFGRTSLEASSRGCATIISNRGGLPETSDH